MTNLPSYDELPIDNSMPPGSSWGLWGADDLFGSLNLLTPERVKRGAACVRKGAVFALNYEIERPEPPLSHADWREPFRHEVIWLRGDIGHDEVLHGWNTQSSSQWDGFRHIRSPVHGFYNGLADEDHGMHFWARRGLAGRAVLADVARWRELEGRPLTPNASDTIEPADLLATLRAQNVEVEPGDVLLIRTGWLSWYRDLDLSGREAAAKQPASVGLSVGTDMLRTLWDLHISAVAADNPGLEVLPVSVNATPEVMAALQKEPHRYDDLFLHIPLIALLGIPIGEYWDLDALAADCASDGVYECLLASSPLNLCGGVASPANALAMK